MAANLAGLHPAVRRAVEAVLRDPEAQRRGLHVVSAFRSPEHQARLFRAAVKKYGSEEAADDWVARPWRSNHGPVLRDDGTRVPYGPDRGGIWGCAVDWGVRGVAAVSGQWPAETVAWISGLCAKHGLRQRMEWEDWHYEPVAGFDYAHEEEHVGLNDAQDRALAKMAAQIDTLHDKFGQTDGTGAGWNMLRDVFQDIRHDRNWLSELVREALAGAGPPGAIDLDALADKVADRLAERLGG